MVYLLKMLIFYSYVKLPEGNILLITINAIILHFPRGLG